MNPIRHTEEKLDTDRMWAAGNRWIPSCENLPDDEEIVLIFSNGEPWTGFHESGNWFYVSGDRVGYAVTHWMHFTDGPELAEAAA